MERYLTSLIKNTIIEEMGLDFEILESLPIYLEIPRENSYGDLSCNIAMKLAGRIQRSPLEIASLIVNKIKKEIGNSSIKNKIENIEIKEPGFINFFFKRGFLYGVLKKIRKERNNFGSSNIGKGRKVQIEFVSANPTGPLNVAHGRQAAVGDTLANILEFLRFKVTREYYLNDEGNQIDILGKSIRARCLELQGKPSEFPEGGYQGKYIYIIAKEIIDSLESGEFEDLDISFFSQYGMKWILKVIRRDLKDFGVKFDNWSSQAKLRKSSKIKKTLKLLKARGFIYERDGALWLRSTDFGDDKDRVVIKSDGSFTYIAPDIAYHKDKFERGFKWIIDLWGPDHHGYIPRLKAAIRALGYKEESTSIKIVQLATLFKDRRIIPMSTRQGEYVTLRQVLDEVGKDAARFFFLMRKMDSHLDFDLALAKEESVENPVYYIQYAHARICNIFNKFAGLAAYQTARTNLTLLKEPEEIEILRILRQFPDVVKTSGESLEPYRLIPYLLNLTTSLHKFYDTHRVISNDKALTQARLILIDCVRTVLANGLRLSGVSAPKKM